MEPPAPQPGRPLNRTTVAAAIPAFHEEAHVRGVAERVCAQLDHVLVVDDGSTDASLFIGTRMNDVREMPFVRRTVNRYMSRRISRLCGQEVPDSQCGYRMIHRTLVPHLLDGTSRFEYETEMLIIASRQGFRIA